MNRDQLLVQTRNLLSEAGFYLSEPLGFRGIGFDIVARRDRELLILKVLMNIDSLSKEDAGLLKSLASALEGRSAVIGIRSSSGKIDEGIVYSRFGIPILSYDTFEEFLKEGVPPFIFAAPGGLYVRINSDLLKEIRRQRNISLGTLAEIAGVSRKAIQMYEEGMGAIVDVAMKMEEFLNEPIVLPLDPFAYDSSAPLKAATDEPIEQNELDSEVFNMLENIGYSVMPTARCPFQAITSDSDILLLTGVEKFGPGLERKAVAVSSISRVVERFGWIVTDKYSKRRTLKRTPLICRDELAKLEDRKKILELILERTN